MQTEEFNDIIGERISKSLAVLVKKAGEYAQNDDRLHNFRAAQGLTGKSMRQTLGGMMLKHTVSIYDMINSDQDYPNAVWDEKLGDHINYLLLLEAVVAEEKKESVEEEVLPAAPQTLTDKDRDFIQEKLAEPAEPRDVQEARIWSQRYAGEEPNAMLARKFLPSIPVYAEVKKADPRYTFVIDEDGEYSQVDTMRVQWKSSADAEKAGRISPSTNDHQGERPLLTPGTQRRADLLRKIAFQLEQGQIATPEELWHAVQPVTDGADNELPSV